MPPDRTETLDDLRREIDRIDETMHRLLMERGAIIDRLIAVKRTAESGSAFRPAREADMMRRLVARHHGRFPFSAVEHVWRTMIATFTHVQAPYTVHVDGSGDPGAARDLARFQMGFDVPLAVHDGAEAVVEAVTRSAGDLGLVPLGRGETAWWRGLGGDGRPQVMARLPFLAYPERPAALPALVIAKPLGAAAAEEISVFALEGAARPGPGRLPGEVVAEAADGGGWSALLALDRGAPPEGARPVGGYARPLQIAAGDLETAALP